MKKLDYSKPEVPEDYKCDDCGATHCKLWREYSAFPPVRLECVDCAIKSQNNPNIAPAFAKIATTVQFKEDGSYIDHRGEETDAIGWRVPAVPDEANVSYWGYSSVPSAGVMWWKSLPLRKNNV